MSWGAVAAVVLLTGFQQLSLAATTFDTYSYYALREQCDGTPSRVDSYEAGFFEPYLSCENACNDSSSSWKSHNTVCNSSDYKENIATAFGSTSYLLLEAFESDCETFRGAVGLASGNCKQVIMYVEEWGFSVYETIQFTANGTLSVRYFTDQSCSSPINGSVTLTFQIDAQDTDVTSDLLNSSTCDGNGYQWTYFTGSSSSSSSATTIPSSSVAADSSSSSESTSGTNVKLIAGTIGGVFAILLALFGYVLYRRNSTGKHPQPGYSRGPATPDCLTGGSLDRTHSGQTGLWSDDVITAKRIPRRDIQIGQLISRGAYGEVYEGLFDDTRVAVKMLSPETRSVIRYVNGFLAEAKLSAGMNHPNIVSFIGVAWKSLSDLCIVLEFMDGGDLRTLLNKYQEMDYPVGIDRQKATIALQVCHALTYLHSLAPPVLHRDLKSRNILLSRSLDAKLTDFGISKENLNQTMTAGVGTSLWMAPEVMLGGHYGDKADMFSFGVVLSELDLHTLPYAHVMDQSTGKGLTEPVVLQHVAMGRLSVGFSKRNPQALIDLGRACVSVDPRLRPTAAEALYKIQVVLAEISVNIFI